MSLDQATRADAIAQETQETQVPESPYLKRALFYAKQGWPVFPLHRPYEGGCSCRKPECADIGKHPIRKPGFLAATTDENQIREWWEFDHPISNIGIRTGKESGIVVLDIDPDKGGEESLRQLEEQYESLPDTPIVRSGGRGKTSLLPASRILRANDQRRLGSWAGYAGGWWLHYCPRVVAREWPVL